MSDNTAPIKATLKAGTGYDAPWLTVDAYNPEDLKIKLDGLRQADSLAAVADTARELGAIWSAGPIVATATNVPAPQPVQQAPQGWGQPTSPAQPAQQQAPVQQAARGGGNYNAVLHPEGNQCQCGRVLEMKKTSTGKTTWRCPDWRWNNGNPTPDHDQEWA